MSKNLERARKTGSLSHRAQKYMKWDDSSDDSEDGPSRQTTSKRSEVPSSATVENRPSTEEAEVELQPEDYTSAGITEPEIHDFLGDESSDSDIEEEMDFDSMTVEESIIYWALATNATHRSVDMILKVFKKAGVRVPGTARTLLQTKRNTSAQIMPIQGGQFWYRGIRECLLSHFTHRKSPVDTFTITVSIDGLPLHKNSGTQFWPILFSVLELPEAPVMTAAIYCGVKKPESLEEYLRPMIDEMNLLVQHGIIIHGAKISIKLRAIVADTPARSFIKGVTGHTGYEGCLKCTVVGTHHPEGRTMTFPGLHAPKRTNQAFRDAAYPGHCKIRTPLLDLANFDIIEDVVVSDRLHLIDLGVMKRLLLGWRDGKLGTQRWLKGTRDNVEAALKKISLPTEIHRKLRKLEYAHLWKGSEFASFLHYAGIVVLKDHLPDDAYQHFLLLFCGVTLLSSNTYRTKWPLAGELLEKFVLDYGDIYGERYIGSNVHNLQHMYDEVLRFGPLPGISTYPFENELQHLKRSLRSKFMDLQQAINRIAEFDSMRMPMTKRHVTFPSLSNRGSAVKIHVRPSFMLQNAPKDCWFLTTDRSILQLQTASETEAGVLLTARRLEDKVALFEKPFNSCEIDVYKGLTDSMSSELIQLNVDRIKCKLVAVPTNRAEEMAFIPLVHTLV